MVLDGAERDSDPNKQALELAFSQYFPKLRGVRVDRIRRGQKKEPLLAHWELDGDGEDEPSRLVAELVAQVLETIANEAAESIKKQKFEVVLLGESLADKPPELTRVAIVIEPEDVAPATRETEMLATISMLRELLRDSAKNYLDLAKISPVLVMANAETAAKLGSALSAASGESAQWEYRRAELEVSARLQAEEIRGRVERSNRMWGTFDDFFEGLKPYLDVAAAEFATPGGNAGPRSGGPTPEELDKVFGGADADLAELGKRFVAATGQEADALKQALRDRWAGLTDDDKGVILGEFQKLPRDRILALGLWMKRAGLK